MTQDEALAYLWSGKRAGEMVDGKYVANPNFGNVWLWATTTKPVTFHTWNGRHPVEKNEKVTTQPAGTRVLVAMISRFGDVGIRARDLTPPSNGYDARVAPEDLKDWSKEP